MIVLSSLERTLIAIDYMIHNMNLGMPGKIYTNNYQLSYVF